MSPTLMLFWAAAALIVYTYILFPALVLLRGWLLRRPYRAAEITPRVSMLIAAHNEAGTIGAKLHNILSLDYPRERLEVLIASDGSTDGTDAIVRRYAQEGVRLLSLPRQGKATALNAAAAAATGDILVFSDANSMYAPDAIRALVRPFADPEVGGVAGNQRYLSDSEVNNGERSYWSFDQKLKQFQSQAGNTTSATGAIYAIRRSLFRAIPAGVTDDFVTSTNVIAQGYRLVFAPDAVAYEPVAGSIGVEFGRKVRVMTRGLRGVLVMRELLNPFRYGFYAIQLFSHKVLRRVVVFPLLVLFLVSPLLWHRGALYQAATLAQVAFYSCGAMGMLLDGTRFGRLKIFPIPSYFCMVNVAALWATLNVLRGHRIDLWEPHLSRGAEVQGSGGAEGRRSTHLRTPAPLHPCTPAPPHLRSEDGGGRSPSSPRLLAPVLSIAVALGLLAGQQPILALSATLAAPLMLTIIAWPDISTLAVIFILYTNTAVVAVRFHGLPLLVGASVPALLIIPLAHYLIFRRQKLIINPVLPLILLFLAIQAFGTLVAENTLASTRTLGTFVTEGIGLYFLITNLVRTPEMLRRVIWVLLMAGAFMGGLSFYQQITRTYDNDYAGFAQVSNAAFGTGIETLQGEVRQPRLAGPIGEKNRYAQIMLMLLPLGLFRVWGERSRLLRALAVIAAGLISVGAALTFSRGAAVGFALMLVMAGFLRYIKPYQLAIVLLGLGLLLQAVPQYGVRLNSLQTLWNLLTDSDSTEIADLDGSFQSRVTENLAAVLVFADHPVIGVGPGMFRYHYQDYAERVGIRVRAQTRQTHNLYLGIAAETGALGLVCFLAIVFATLHNLACTRKRYLQSHPELANMATGFALAILTYLTTGIFLHFAYIRYFWLMMALASAASYVAGNSMPATDGSAGRE